MAKEKRKDYLLTKLDIYWSKYIYDRYCVKAHILPHLTDWETVLYFIVSYSLSYQDFGSVYRCGFE